HDDAEDLDEANARFGCGASGSQSGTPQPSPIGPMYLFFGCRRAEWDYLYAEDFARFVEQGVLTEFHVAFSQEDAAAEGDAGASAVGEGGKVYVQHRLEQHGAQIADLLLH